jgi:hypothetical protein
MTRGVPGGQITRYFGHHSRGCYMRAPRSASLRRRARAAPRRRMHGLLVNFALHVLGYVVRLRKESTEAEPKACFETRLVNGYYKYQTIPVLALAEAKSRPSLLCLVLSKTIWLYERIRFLARLPTITQARLITVAWCIVGWEVSTLFVKQRPCVGTSSALATVHLE